MPSARGDAENPCQPTHERRREAFEGGAVAHLPVVVGAPRSHRPVGKDRHAGTTTGGDRAHFAETGHGDRHVAFGRRAVAELAFFVFAPRLNAADLGG